MAARIQYWLMKSEPNAYSIDTLAQDITTPWDGIRNYQARNMMRDQMRVGDQALFYRSNAGTETGVVGVMEVAAPAHPDATQFDPKSDYYDPRSPLTNPRWVCVDMRFVERFPRVVTLTEMKSVSYLTGMKILQKGNRLSITPVTKGEFERVYSLAQDNRT